MICGTWKIRADGGTVPMVADIKEARQAIKLFADPTGGFELMALKSGQHRTHKGDQVDKICEAVGTLPNGIGVYFRVNPVSSANKPANNPDVIKRRWLYIDVDPAKPEEQKDNPATDDEKSATASVCDQVNEYLTPCGWPTPVIVDSGNGYGLFYRCDLPNDKLVQANFRKLLALLAEKFTGLNGIIDKSVHNANRLAKLPGTWARKGTPSADRPHRPCKIHYVPDTIEMVTAEQLAEAAGGSEPEKPMPEKTYTAPPKGNEAPYGRKALDMECARVAMARGGADDGRNNALNRAAFSLGQLVAGGVLLEEIVYNRLYEVAIQAGLEERETRLTIQSGLDAGKKSPRGVPESKDPKAKFEHGKEQKTKPAPEGQLIYWASEVTPRPVEWLWPQRIPLGKLTTFAGNGGLGKTFVLCDIMARISRGTSWPDGSDGGRPASRCLFISGEDDPEDTLVPRMIEMDADLSRIAFLKTTVLDKFTLADLEILDKALEQMGNETRFVGIDPPTAYLGDVNDHKNAELRGLLTPLMLWAKKHNLSVVFNTHVNKPQGQKVEAMMRVMGSVAWVNAMRSAYMFTRDPNDFNCRYFIGMKSNLGGEKKGLRYRISPTASLAKVEWLGDVDMTADDAVNSQTGNRKKSVIAAEWLAEQFAKVDKLPSDVIWKAKEQTTMSKDALKEAKEDMGIKAKQEVDDEGNRQWYWYWPKEARTAWTTSGPQAKPDIPE